MFKNLKKEMTKLPKKLIVIVMLLAIISSYFNSIFSVKAQSYGEGNNFIQMDIVNNLGFTIGAVTVNSYTWENSQDEFHASNDRYHIVINVAGNETTEDKVPSIQYGGNWNGLITMSTANEDGNYSFALDVDLSEVTENRNEFNFIGLSVIEKTNNGGNEPNPEPGDEPNFDGKAYVVWSCGDGTCYHYFDNIPNFNDGNSTFYKDTDITADNDNSISFDVHAEYKGWLTKTDFESWVSAYKAKYNLEEINWANVKPEDIIGDPPDMREWEEKAIEAGECTRDYPTKADFEDCVDAYKAENSNDLPFYKLQPLGEPDDNNAYVSYGDRMFKVVIYNSEFKGVTMGNLDELTYYPASWTNQFLRQDQFDISGTTKNNPTGINSILLESTVIIRALNYNSFAIKSIEALDVPGDAVTITKDNNGDFRLTFSSNFYDNVTFKVTDTNNEVSYFLVKRYTIDGWVRHDNNNNNDAPILSADFYFDREKTYEDFDITAKIVYKDGTSKNVSLTAKYGIDDGLGNYIKAYEADQEDPTHYLNGKGLKKATFEYPLDSTEEEGNIARVYLNAEYKGSTVSSYAGAYAGSGQGTLANIYQGEEE